MFCLDGGDFASLASSPTPHCVQAYSSNTVTFGILEQLARPHFNMSLMNLTDIFLYFQIFVNPIHVKMAVPVWPQSGRQNPSSRHVYVYQSGMVIIVNIRLLMCVIFLLVEVCCICLILGLRGWVFEAPGWCQSGQQNPSSLPVYVHQNWTVIIASIWLLKCVIFRLVEVCSV